jgi:hypothetical protein
LNGERQADKARDDEHQHEQFDEGEPWPVPKRRHGYRSKFSLRLWNRL